MTDTTAGPRRPVTVFLVAGEPSGDALGGRLMAALKQRYGDDIRFLGVGGPRMIEHGLESLFPMDELSVMGVFEILPRAIPLLRRVDQTVAAVRRCRPDIVVTIDAPAFSFRVARKLKHRAFPLVHLVAPTVWAWRPGRARVIAGRYDHLLCLLPFEPPYFEAVGLGATFIGHPVVEGPLRTADAERFRRRYGLSEADRPLIVLPGSRRGEVLRLLPVFGEAVDHLVRRQADLRPIVPTVRHVAAAVRAAVAAWPGNPIVVEDEQAKYDAFKAGDAAIAASGTVALELSLSGTPTVVAYKVSWLTAQVVRRLLLVDTATLTNLILDDKVIPEHIQEHCTADALVGEVERLLADPAARQRQMAAGQRVGRILGLTGATTPSEVAADTIARLMEERWAGRRHPSGRVVSPTSSPIRE